MVQPLRFKTASCQVMSIEHLSRILVQWELEPTSQDLHSIVFVVDRGESPTNLSQISGDISPFGLMEFMDLTPRMIDLHKVYYYRVRAVERKEGLILQEFSTPVFTWETDLDLVGLYVVEEHLFAYRYVMGVPTVIFKKRKDAGYCPNCFDPVLKRVTKSNCTICFGTGKQLGFYPFIEGWMEFNPDPKAAQIVEWGERQASQTDIQFTNYPLLGLGDVIVEIQPNNYWKVVGPIRTAEKRRSITLQVARLDAVNRSDVEYKLTVPDDVRRRLAKELEDIKREREF